MGVPTLTADDPADMETQVTVPGFHGPVIVTVNGETAGMSTGTGKSVELEGIYHIIINFLRNRIAKIDRYSYHKNVRWVYECFLTQSVCIAAHTCVLVTGNQTLVREAPVTFVYSNMVMITEGTV